jgi:hypothetical protein
MEQGERMNVLRMTDKQRVQECLNFLATGADVNPQWRMEVEAEARAFGLLAPLEPIIGCNCRPDIDRGIVYGGDLVDAF